MPLKLPSWLRGKPKPPAHPTGSTARPHAPQAHAAQPHAQVRPPAPGELHRVSPLEKGPEGRRYKTRIFTQALMTQVHPNFADCFTHGREALEAGNVRLAGFYYGKLGNVQGIREVAATIGDPKSRARTLSRQTAFLTRATLGIETSPFIEKRREVVTEVIRDALRSLAQLNKEIAGFNPKTNPGERFTALIASGKAYAALSNLSQGLVTPADAANYKTAARAKIAELDKHKAGNIELVDAVREISEMLDPKNRQRLLEGEL